MHSTVRRIRPVRVAVVATAALLLAGCGGDSEGQRAGGATSASSSASASAPSGSAGASEGAHNAQDVSFAQGMIPHHRQAVEMAALAADRASAPRVKALAERIKGAQDPEIRTMSGWLTAWGEAVPEQGGMDHSGHSGMAGMMSGADMTALEKASGAEFDTRFTRMMIEHHEGAVEMAGTEKAKGRYAPALALADAIITAQNAEIAEMKGFLGKK
ncbi:DUF305 domain-containing protein [Streptomyces niveiscabiei]|uniref:DUF305 domain-containing protein n=1 Tax=Streptomyces niveiscabiei TaxID=164115 RepID=UPI0029AC2D34|nr:DUF305 domain-containing protein [Streptomyces niveiscabiei]MDX3384392.1 DUF305 domain-containing protein [Streptomyces niveiscabiei]